MKKKIRVAVASVAVFCVLGQSHMAFSQGLWSKPDRKSLVAKSEAPTKTPAGRETVVKVKYSRNTVSENTGVKSNSQKRAAQKPEIKASSTSIPALPKITGPLPEGIRKRGFTSGQKHVMAKIASGHKPRLKDHDGGKVSQVKQNQIAATYDLASLVDSKARKAFIKRFKLEKVHDNDSLKVNNSVEHRDEDYLYPFAKEFFRDLAKANKKATGNKLVLTSIWRSEHRQEHVGFAPTSGIAASSHPWATTADLGKGSNSGNLAFLKRVLPKIEALKAIEALEESTCMHIMVSPAYRSLRPQVLKILKAESEGERSTRKAKNHRSRR